jgi:hypothetical protein
MITLFRLLRLQLLKTEPENGLNTHTQTHARVCPVRDEVHAIQRTIDRARE